MGFDFRNQNLHVKVREFPQKNILTTLLFAAEYTK